MDASEIRRVLVVGAGTMGQQIAAACVMHGLEVMLYDVEQNVLDGAVEGIRKILSFFVKASRMTGDESNTAMARIMLSTDLAKAADDADIVSESVPEDPALKGKIFGELNGLCPPKTVFTTNTSTLLPSMFAQATGRPERFAALHFHDVRLSTIVDIMPHPGTAGETVEIIRGFAVRIGQTPIVMRRESPGYVFNFMLSNLFESAMTLASKGIASVEDIDRSWMGVSRMPIGPFGLMDSVGLQTVWKITDFWARKLNDQQKIRNADFVKSYVDKGLLGVKTGRGFYEYPKPLFSRPDFIDGKAAG